jgi:transmembrane sensor
MRNYENFQTEDFLMDDYFIEWMVRPSPETFRFWEDFKIRNPLQLVELDRAISLYRALELNNQYLTAGEKRILKEKIWSQVNEEAKRRRGKFFLVPWIKVAAAIALLVVAGISVYRYSVSKRMVLIETAYAERHEVTLPDASVISMNGNTFLRYPRDFKDVREVWLEGEAFFQVKDLSEKKFVVHTEGLDIEVLGTSFNVDNRESVTKVVLNTGKIKVQVNGDSRNENVLMKPGDMIEYKKETSTLVKQVVNPELYSAWKKDTLDFNRVSVSDVARTLEERYGYRITIADPSLGRKFFTGRFSSKDIDIVITAMEKALGMEAVYEGKKKMIWKLNQE